jgi:hypothetical protein
MHFDGPRGAMQAPRTTTIEKLAKACLNVDHSGTERRAKSEKRSSETYG